MKTIEEMSRMPLLVNRHIFISAGHTNVSGKDQGAQGNGYSEGVLTVELRKLIINELKELGEYVYTDPDSFNLVEDIKIMNALLIKDDIAIDLHFNASDPMAHGTEVLIPNDFSTFEKNLAIKLCNEISTTLKTKNRGVKTESASPHGRLGFMRPNCENILIEICFVTNTTDIRNYQLYKDEVAKVIAKLLYESLTLN